MMDDIREDIRDILNDEDGFAVTVTLTSPDGKTTVVSGTTKRINLGVDPIEGKRINSLEASVTIFEKDLKDKNYPVRDLRGDVDLANQHLARVKDSTGEEKSYIIRQCFPDETVGIIVCILGEYA